MLFRNRKRQIHEIVMHCNLCRSAVTLRRYQIFNQMKQALFNECINKTRINNRLLKHSYYASCKLRHISSQNKTIEEYSNQFSLNEIEGRRNRMEFKGQNSKSPCRIISNIKDPSGHVSPLYYGWFLKTTKKNVYFFNVKAVKIETLLNIIKLVFTDFLLIIISERFFLAVQIRTSLGTCDKRNNKALS